MLCRPSQWVMPKYKLLIAIHLVGFVQQSITWSGTKAYIPLTVRARLIITWPTISPPGVGVKCGDDETNEQRILRAPAIALADHRAVYDAKCGHPQGVKLLKCGHLRTGGGGRKTGRFCRCPLWTIPYIEVIVRHQWNWSCDLWT